MKQRQNELAIKAWVYFTFNYYDPKEFIKYICEKAGRPDLQEHFYQKFSDIYERVGSKAAMNCFYCELSPTYQSYLAEYAVKIYALNGIYLDENDKALLGL